MKLKYPTLDNIVPLLVGIIATSIIGMTFVNYAICNFKVNQSLHFLYLVNGFGKDKKPPSKCDDNTSQSIQTLMALLATIIALKADLRKKDEQTTSSQSSSQGQTEV
jgi:hypothetical protein